MFKNWDFLLGEIWFLIVLAALLGLFVGWLLWGGRRQTVSESSSAEVVALRSQLEQCQAASKEKDELIGRLEARLEGCGVDPKTAPASSPSAAATPARLVPTGKTASADADHGNANKGSRPKALETPLDGKADNLKKIKGVGPKLEQLCNRLGFWHFDQIANWTDDEVVWVDANLEGFKGRVTRDNWVEQARLLAEGRATEFSKRVEAGDVYDQSKS
jgi:predicted flap endonuclease-1-like 5' DNA nuclease